MTSFNMCFILFIFEMRKSWHQQKNSQANIKCKCGRKKKRKYNQCMFCHYLKRERDMLRLELDFDKEMKEYAQKRLYEDSLDSVWDEFEYQKRLYEDSLDSVWDEFEYQLDEQYWETRCGW